MKNSLFAPGPVPCRHPDVAPSLSDMPLSDCRTTVGITVGSLSELSVCDYLCGYSFGLYMEYVYGMACIWNMYMAYVLGGDNNGDFFSGNNISAKGKVVV
jgi:hypothetical protein